MKGKSKACRAVFVLTLLCILTAAAFLSCEESGGTLALSAVPPIDTRLGAIFERCPLPPGWSLAPPGGKEANATIELSWRFVGDSSRPASNLVLARRWLAPSLSAEDPRYDLSPEEAVNEGLVELSTISLPRRAVSVSGSWPGDKDYPFTQELVLGISTREARLPTSLRLWLGRLSPQGPTAAEEVPLLINAVGDIQIGPDEAAWLFQGEKGFSRLFGAAARLLKRPGILVGNLEGPVTERGSPNPRKRFQFRFPPKTTAALREAGFDLFLFANNHGLDFGPEGFLDSLADARASSMPLAGAGMDSSEAAESVSPLNETAAPQSRLRFFGFAFFPPERFGFTASEAAAGEGLPGINTDAAATIAGIRKAAEAGDFVVVLCHGGNEYRFEPSPGAKALYRRFIDAGASLVIGSHPHLLQGVETRKGGLIAYSLGNFLFTGEKEPDEALHSAMLSILVYRGRVRGIGVVPIRVSITGSDLDPDAATTIADFARRSAELGDSSGR